MPNFKIKSEEKDKRLDLFLHEHYSSLSRTFIQKKIKKGDVKVNGEISSVHRFLRVGDVVDVEDGVVEGKEVREGKEGEQKISNFKFQISKEEEEKLGNYSLDIIAETDDYLVINKPRGLVVHTGVLNEKNTLARILLEKYPDIEKVGESPERPGIVHRLDKEVSGIMVIAKTQKMFLNLKKQFQERTTKKEYIALVYGYVAKPNGKINFPIARSEKDGAKMAAHPACADRSISQDQSAQTGGREAITDFTVLKDLVKWTLLSVKIKTGRTHQIRVHLNAYGHPIVGDKIYKPRKLKPTLKFGDRLFLHAWKLGFTDLNGEWKEFESPLPEEFRRI